MRPEPDYEHIGSTIAANMVGKGWQGIIMGSGFDMTEKELLLFIAAYLQYAFDSPSNFQAMQVGLEAVRAYRKMKETP